jgi:hypothetical protein
MKPSDVEEWLCAACAVMFVLILVWYMLLILPNL